MTDKTGNKLKICIILLGVSFYIYYGIYKMLFVHFELVGGDFLCGYYAARNFVENRNLYAMSMQMITFMYPPFSVIVYLPFYFLNETVAKLAWFILTHVCILLSAFLLYRLGNTGNKLNSGTAVAAVFCFSMPLHVIIQSGNLNLLILLGLIVIHLLLLSYKDRNIPLILSLLSCLKIFPALFITAFFPTKKWWVIKTYLIYTLSLATISVAIFGINTHIDFLRILSEGLYLKGIELELLLATSLPFVLKLVLPKNHDVKIVIQIIDIFFLAFLLSLWWRQAKKVPCAEYHPMKTTLDFFILNVIVLLTFPSAWYHYFAFLIIPFYFILIIQFSGGSPLKYFPLFTAIFIFINFWEILFYQLSLPPEGLTMRIIWEKRDHFPILSPFLFSLPFLFNLLFYFWLLINYSNLQKGLNKGWGNRPSEKFHN